jgi:hypothetical protein
MDTKTYDVERDTFIDTIRVTGIDAGLQIGSGLALSG